MGAMGAVRGAGAGGVVGGKELWEQWEVRAAGAIEQPQNLYELWVSPTPILVYLRAVGAMEVVGATGTAGAPGADRAAGAQCKVHLDVLPTLGEPQELRSSRESFRSYGGLLFLPILTLELLQERLQEPGELSGRHWKLGTLARGGGRGGWSCRSCGGYMSCRSCGRSCTTCDLE